MPVIERDEPPVMALLTVRPIAQGPRQRAPFAARQVKVGDVVDLVYVHGSDYTDTRRGEVTRRYVSGSVEVRFTEPTRRVHG
jgi:hypothetical protein